MKKIISLMILCGWLPDAGAQYQAGLDQYCYVQDKTISYSPVAWLQLENNWYTSVRYNYEMEKAVSILAGKVFENNSGITYSLCPMAGIVAGSFNGGAVALNALVEKNKMYFSIQSQFTFSFSKPNKNFMYTWCDLGFKPINWIAAGMSLQHSNLDKARLEKGFFIKVECGQWELPVYFFNVATSGSYVVAGISWTWQHNRRSKPVGPFKHSTLNNNINHL